MIYRRLPWSVGTLLLAAPAFAFAAANDPVGSGFLEGARVDLTSLTYYYNRDFRSGEGPGKRAEWAQGFLLSNRSGYTPGPVGFGLDVLGVLDVKLDGVARDEGIGLLPMDHGRTRSVFARAGLTGKARAGESELRVGTLIPQEPLITASISRIMPQTFQGGIIESKDIPGLDMYFARYTSTWYRDGIGSQDLTLFNKNMRYAGTPASDRFDIGSVQYQLGKQLTLRYQHGTLDDLYRQQMLNAIHKVKVEGGLLTSEVRYFRTDDQGRGLAGRIDNQMLNVLVTYGHGPHEFGAGLQRLSGPTAMPWINGTDGNVFNWTFINDFLETQEHSYQARYILTGDKLGMPGWRFLLRYVHADNANPATTDVEGREWQRDVEIDYRFQSGWLKHVSLHWINGTLRSNFQRDAEENRLIIRYEAPLHQPR